jgi:hypothetical protein
LILNYSWNASWTSSTKSVTFICDVWEQSAGPCSMLSECFSANRLCGNLDSESIIPPSRVYFGFCLIYSPQWTRDRSRCSLCSMWLPLSTQLLTPSCSTGSPSRSGSRDQHTTGCGRSSSVTRRQFTTVDLSQFAQSCVLVWRVRSITATVFCSVLIPISSTGSSLYWTRPLDWSWTSSSQWRI